MCRVEMGRTPGAAAAGWSGLMLASVLEGVRRASEVEKIWFSGVLGEGKTRDSTAGGLTVLGLLKSENRPDGALSTVFRTSRYPISTLPH